MIDRSTVDRIFAAANIVEVVGDFVSLRKKGVNYQACCPFHNEKTPSFVVSPTKGLFKCFGCGKGGNAVTFVMEHENMTYPEALKYVAKKYGIEVQERELTPEEEKRNDDRESMMVVNSFASDWMRQQLTETDEGQSVGLGYFRERGFTDATIARFGLGYSPEARDALYNAATGAGYKEEFLIATGLCGKSDSGRVYDRFAGRVMFPVHSVSGRVIAFGGRTLRTDGKTAKYINSPESEIYHKSDVLYGLFLAKRAVTQEDACILVEGYTDVMRMHQSGVENVVASSGTSLTKEQIRLISRFTQNVTVIFDGDPAGIKASLRGIDMILAEGLNVRVVPLPDGDDPDSFARGRSGEQLKDYIREHEEDFIAFKTRALLADAGGDPIRKAELITDVVTSISVVPDPVLRSVYTREAARSLDMDLQVLTSEVARRRISHHSDSQAREFIRTQQASQERERRRIESVAEGSAAGAGSNMDELEKELVKYLLKYGDRNFEYKEGKTIVSLNVAAIIINDLEANGLVLGNRLYRELYDRYRELYNEREERMQQGADEYWKQPEDGGEQTRPAQEEIGMHHFINHPDPEVANTAVNILTDDENYVVSRMWRKFDIVVESELERLPEAVPRAVVLYKSKAIEKIIKELQKKLANADLSDEELADITFQIATLNKERRSIAHRLSRLIF